ncbi:MAG TPA: hypothetical protein VJ456_15155 [Acidimicrobiia bacterium]|nr:hypothetical protein [Acidimicrobiia bacterium]
MENETPVPEEKKPRFDPQSGKIEPAPSEMEGARVMANEAREEIEDETPLDDRDVRQLAEDYVTRRGADDTENFKDYAEERASRGGPPPP